MKSERIILKTEDNYVKIVYLELSLDIFVKKLMFTLIVLKSHKQFLF